MLIDELIDMRAKAREGKNYKLCDITRHKLDAELVFIFDAPWGQQIYYLTESYFKRKPPEMTNRKYVEYKIQADIKADQLLDAWLYTVRQTLDKNQRV